MIGVPLPNGQIFEVIDGVPIITGVPTVVETNEDRGAQIAEIENEIAQAKDGPSPETNPDPDKLNSNLERLRG